MILFSQIGLILSKKVPIINCCRDFKSFKRIYFFFNSKVSERFFHKTNQFFFLFICVRWLIANSLLAMFFFSTEVTNIGASFRSAVFGSVCFDIRRVIS